MRKSLGRLSYDNYMPIRPLGKTIPHRCNNQGDACTSTQYNTHRPTTGHSCHMFYNRINNNDLLILTGWEKGPYALHARHSEPVFFCLLLLLFVVVVVVVFLSAPSGPLSRLGVQFVRWYVAVSSNGDGNVLHWWWLCTGNDEAAASATAVAAMLRCSDSVGGNAATTSAIGAQKEL